MTQPPEAHAILDRAAVRRELRQWLSWLAVVVVFVVTTRFLMAIPG